MPDFGDGPSGPFEQFVEGGLLSNFSGPGDPHEQCAVTIDSGIADGLGSADAGKSGGSAPHTSHSSSVASQPRLRFDASVSLTIKQPSAFSVFLISPASNRGTILIDSIEVHVFSDKKLVFTAKLPVTPGTELKPGATLNLPFTPKQEKALSSAEKVGNVAVVNVVYLAPRGDKLTIGIKTVDGKPA